MSSIIKLSAALLLLAGCLKVDRPLEAPVNYPPSFEIDDSLWHQKIQPGRLFSLELQAYESDPSKPLIFAILTGPEGMSLVGRQLEWTPKESDRGNHAIRLEVEGKGGLKDTATLELNVNRPPVFLQNEATLKASPDRFTTFTLRLDDYDGDSLALSFLNPRAGMQIRNGVFQWMPQASDTGEVTAMLVANDLRDGADTMLFRINVNRPPMFGSGFSGVDTLFVGNSGARTFPATDADGDTLTYRLLQPPAGATSARNRVSLVAGDCTEGWTRILLEAADGRDGKDTVAWQLLVMRSHEALNGSWQPASSADIRHQAGMALILAQDRHFGMGKRCPENSRSWKLPMHRVDFTYDFWMDTTEVTAGEFYRVQGLAMPNRYDDPRESATDISWYQAALYCNAKSKLEGLDTVYAYAKDTTTLFNGRILDSIRIRMDRNGYRLPTSAEWEYAARGGTFQVFYWGYDTAAAVTGKYEWTENTPKATTPWVAEKLPNPYGLYDMNGNVTEWINDYFTSVPDSSNQTNPIGPLAFEKYSEPVRTIRGGFRWSQSEYLPIHMISNLKPYSGSTNCGFRVVRMESIPASFSGVVIR